MRNIVINANEHGSLFELRFPPAKGYAESWSWQPAFSPRAGELTVSRVDKKIATMLAEYALANDCEGTFEAFPHDWIEQLLATRKVVA